MNAARLGATLWIARRGFTVDEVGEGPDRPEANCGSGVLSVDISAGSSTRCHSLRGPEEEIEHGRVAVLAPREVAAGHLLGERLTRSGGLPAEAPHLLEAQGLRTEGTAEIDATGGVVGCPPERYVSVIRG